MVRKILEHIVGLGRFIVNSLGGLGRLILKIGYWTLVIGIPFGVIWYLVGVASLSMQFGDTDEYRGAASTTGDLIDKPITRENIRYLDQNWDQGESLWFYNISQGSNLLPYDFFMALEQKDSRDKFKSNENINRFRYLPQMATDNNPDALPVGMVKDSYDGKDYMGFSCSACHTSQINYKGIGLRIDGGPAAANMEAFLSELVAALEATNSPSADDADKKERFYAAVLKGQYSNRKEVDKDLVKFIEQLKTYTQINEPVWPDDYQPQITKDRVTHYGFARLDAFGRIYNRVLQHIMDLDSLEEILWDELPPSVYAGISDGLSNIRESSDQTDIVVKVLAILEPELRKLDKTEGDAILMNLRSKMYNAANAPVSYPYLWDISQHDYVQWTGLVSNGELGPLGRNVGQVIGVFGTLEWQKKPKLFNLSSRFGGNEADKFKLDLKSSINKVNLRRVEKQLHSLQSPQWPEEYLPEIDDGLLADGEKVFNQYCYSCHKNIIRDDPARRIITHISKQPAVGTDPVLAMNTVNYRGNSGLLRDQYVDGSLGKLAIERTMPVASLVKFSSKGVVLESDPDRLVGFRTIEWLWGILKSLKDNPVKGTAKQGNYDLPTPQQPLAPVMAYKARSLNGIWATAPYLHNGSIPNLYELLLPKKRPGDPVLDENGDPIEYRRDQFMVGSREFDAERVGFRSSDYDGFLYDTSIRGNSNAGHEYAAGRTGQFDGRFIVPSRTVEKDGVVVEAQNMPLPPLTKPQRLALLEYLKTL